MQRPHGVDDGEDATNCETMPARHNDHSIHCVSWKTARSAHHEGMGEGVNLELKAPDVENADWDNALDGVDREFVYAYGYCKGVNHFLGGLAKP